MCRHRCGLHGGRRDTAGDVVVDTVVTYDLFMSLRISEFFLYIYDCTHTGDNMHVVLILCGIIKRVLSDCEGKRTNANVGSDDIISSLALSLLMLWQSRVWKEGTCAFCCLCVREKYRDPKILLSYNFPSLKAETASVHTSMFMTGPGI